MGYRHDFGFLVGHEPLFEASLRARVSLVASSRSVCDVVRLGPLNERYPPPVMSRWLLAQPS